MSNDHSHALMERLGLALPILVLRMRLNVPFNLILSKSQWKIELKGIVLTTLRLLEARCVGCCCSGTSVSGPSWIGRVVIV